LQVKQWLIIIVYLMNSWHSVAVFMYYICIFPINLKHMTIPSTRWSKGVWPGIKRGCSNQGRITRLSRNDSSRGMPKRGSIGRQVPGLHRIEVGHGEGETGWGRAHYLMLLPHDRSGSSRLISKWGSAWVWRKAVAASFKWIFVVERTDNSSCRSQFYKWTHTLKGTHNSILTLRI
jgi:hypothetical protein